VVVHLGHAFDLEVEFAIVQSGRLGVTQVGQVVLAAHAGLAVADGIGLPVGIGPEDRARPRVAAVVRMTARVDDLDKGLLLS
jgi:hypothetical protein